VDDDEQPSTTASGRPAAEARASTAQLPKKTRNLEEAMMTFLSSRREAGPIHDLAFDPTDERQAFATWFASRLKRIPDDRYMLIVKLW